MELINKNREPTPRELRVFGILLAAFCSIAVWFVLYRTGSWTAAIVLWSAVLLLCTFYYTVSAARRMIFHAWMAVVYPIGWLTTHALLAAVFYLIITPIGLAQRGSSHLIVPSQVLPMALHAKTQCRIG